ncbi:MAG: hypothetical protein PHY43_04700 [Verrucomicrobiales bacterium]|nr:hypothetical protein [Verrucomicrobiales bacterium]
MNGWINPGLNGPFSGSSAALAFEKYRREGDFVRLAPSDAFVFLDERPDSINDGWFRVETSGYSPLNLADLTITDLPAVYHNDATSFTFADGHSEFHRWRGLQKLALKMAGGKRQAIPAPNDQDVQWLMEHATKPTAAN